MATLFTKIIDGDIPGRFVWADEVAVAFGTIAPITDGHVLVVPRAEILQLTDAPDDVLTHLMLVARTIGQAQQHAWDAPRAALLVAGFEVPHLHLHVLPAWDEASLTFRTPATTCRRRRWTRPPSASGRRWSRWVTAPTSLRRSGPPRSDSWRRVTTIRRARGRVASGRARQGRSEEAARTWRDVGRPVWPRSRASSPGS